MANNPTEIIPSSVFFLWMGSTASRMLRSPLLLTNLPAPETLAFSPWMEGVEKQNRGRRSAKHDAFSADRDMNSETHLQTREKDCVCITKLQSQRGDGRPRKRWTYSGSREAGGLKGILFFHTLVYVRVWLHVYIQVHMWCV